MKIGFIGLGKMGSRMARKLLRENHDLVVWNRSPQVVEEFKRNQESEIRNQEKNIHNSSFIIHDSRRGKLTIATTIEDLVKKLEMPRIVWMMVPAGEATEQVLSEVLKYVQASDIVIDGGNSFYKDTERRYGQLGNQGIRLLGVGVSGGIIAAEQGYPLMVGGDAAAYKQVGPVLDSLSKPSGGHEYFGEGGAGHFVKMIHNGIEYGIMQSLGEGFSVLEKAPYQFDLLKVAKLYQKGTLVSGFMLDRAVEVLSKPSILSSIDGSIDATGEAEWAVKQAKEEGVEVEIIERSLEFRRRSRKDKKVQQSFAAKMVAALRNAFGGHEVKEKERLE